MSYDTSTVSFDFRFVGEHARQEATDCFDSLPATDSVNNLTKRVIRNDEEIYFVSTEIDLDATPEYVKSVLAVMERFAPTSN